MDMQHGFIIIFNTMGTHPNAWRERARDYSYPEDWGLNNKSGSGSEMLCRITRPMDPNDLNYKEDEVVVPGPKSKHSKFRLSKKLEAQKTQEPERRHFSHGHPLRRCQVQVKDDVNCSGCERELSGTAYGCTSCGFFLHKSCFELPEQIPHRSHPRHALNLISSYKALGKGPFTCNACGDGGSAFDYHCATCSYNLHVDCAYLPKTLDCYAHAHKLTLSYAAPFTLENLDIEGCDICGMPIASNRWGYYCVDCDYAAHLECAKSKEKKENNCSCD